MARNPIHWKTAAIEGGGLRLGVIDNRRTNRHCIVLTGSGSPLRCLPLAQQIGWYQDMSETVKRTVSVDERYSAEWSMVFRRRPENIMAVASNLDRYLHPKVLRPPAGDKVAQFQHDLMRDMVQGTVDDGAAVTMAVVISIKEQGALAKAKKGKKLLTAGDLPREPLLQMADNARNGLEASGVTDVEVLDHDALLLYLRQTWDVSTIDDYYGASLDERRDRAKRLHWPQRYIYVRDNHCVIDGTYHTVLQVVEGPTMKTPDYYRMLYAVPDVKWLSISSVGETVKSRKEVLARNIADEVISGYAELYGSGNETPGAAKKREERANQIQLLFDSGVTQRFSLLVGISSESLEGLELDVARTEQWIRKMDLSSIRIEGRTLQIPAVLSANAGPSML